MKKLFSVLAAVLLLAFAAQAQPRAIGVRAGYAAQLSYQHTLGGENFLEADLGWNLGFLGVGLSYDFSITPSAPVNFYVGPTIDLGGVPRANMFVFGVGAQLGIEYQFNFPLQLSLDWRPMYYRLGQNNAFGWEGLALGIRYRF